MNRTFFVILFTLVVLTLPVHADDDKGEEAGWSARLNEFDEEMEKIKKNSREIYQVFDMFDLEIVENEYEKLNVQVSRVEKVLNEMSGNESTAVKNKFYDLFESALDSYNRLVNYYDFYRQMEDKKEAWSNEYFSLWEQTYAWKTRMENNYVKEEKMNVHYGGMSDYKYKSVIKRQLYEACNIYYDAGMEMLKGTGDCDYYDRIQILKEMLPVIQKCEKLAYEEDTRPLEKKIKKIEDPEKISKMIMGFELDDQ